MSFLSAMLLPGIIGVRNLKKKWRRHKGLTLIYYILAHAMLSRCKLHAQAAQHRDMQTDWRTDGPTTRRSPSTGHVRLSLHAVHWWYTARSVHYLSDITGQLRTAGIHVDCWTYGFDVRDRLFKTAAVEASEYTVYDVTPLRILCLYCNRSALGSAPGGLV